MYKYILSIVFFINGWYINAQQDSIHTSPPSDNRTSSFTTIFYGEPGKAALYSLFIPGGGQIYNKRYWKLPIVYAGEGFAAINLLDALSAFRSRDRCWKSLVVDTTRPHPDCGERSMADEAFEERQAARSNKETAWIIMGAAHFLGIVEAFVDRHLINFDTSEDLSFHNMPNANLVIDNYNIPSIELINITISLNLRHRATIIEY